MTKAETLLALERFVAQLPEAQRNQAAGALLTLRILLGDSDDKG
ncbi:MAG: hypothetical protein ABFE07_09150 [Armatimonadia bacterium]